jgi:4-hydroxybenzoate polyprenyltransferase
VKAGVKSTAILFGSYVKEILAVFALAFLACMYYAGVRNQQGLAFFLVSVGGGALHFAWQLLSLDVEKPEDCWNKFMASFFSGLGCKPTYAPQANHNIGYLIWAGMLLDYAAKTKAA